MDMAESSLIRPDDGLLAKYGNEEAFEPSLLQDTWRIVWLNRFLVTGIVAACLILALIVSLLVTPQYTSSARVKVDRIQANVSNVEGVEPAGDILQYEEFYSTQYALLESTNLAERVARSLNLASDDEFIEAFDLAAEETIANASSRQADQAIGEVLLEQVSISPIRGSSLIDVKFTSPSPALSARIAAAWVDEFIATSIERQFSASNDAREFLQEQIAQLRERLEASERQFVTYASNSGIVTVGSDIGDGERTRETLVGTNLSAMNAALATARADRIAAESALRAGEAATDDQATATMRSLRAEIAAERAKMLTRFESDYPPVMELSNQLAELDREIGAGEGRLRGDLQRAYQAAANRERGLQTQVDELRGRFNDEQRATIQYNILRREVDTNRELYNGLLQRYKEIGVAGVEASNAQLIDAPKVPDEPSSPNLPLNLALGLLAGIGLAGGFLFVREQIDRSLRDPADVKNVLGLPLLGVTPRMPNELIVEDLDDPKSEMAEAYLSIGTMLDLSTDHGFPRTAMLTSSSPSEGKTSSAYALANRLARSGRKAVLVDFDLRNPSVGGRLGIPNRAGVTTYLTGNSTLAELIQAEVRPNLDVMTAGMMPPNPGELISSDRTASLIAELAGRYDHVVIDAPPILGIADAPMLASRVEGVVFIIEANRIGMRQLASALERLRNVKADILGAIVTKLDNRNSEYGYGYGYGYGKTKDETASV